MYYYLWYEYMGPNFIAIIFFQFLCREHVDLLGFLDYEIWKASHMLAQDLPLRKQEQSGIDSNYQVWKNFGPCWKSN